MSLCVSVTRLSSVWRSRFIGTTLVSAPPQIARSASPRWIVRNASPIARWLLASAQVIVLLGPFSS